MPAATTRTRAPMTAETTGIWRDLWTNDDRRIQDPAVVRRLLDDGADPDAAYDASGNRPLHGACMAGPLGDPKHRAIDVRMLLAAGADPRRLSATGRLALHEAAGHGTDPASVRALLAAGSPADARDHAGRTPLASACMRSSSQAGTAIVRRLLAAGADPRSVDASGVSVLAHAVEHRVAAATIAALLHAGAPIDAGALRIAIAEAATHGGNDTLLKTLCRRADDGVVPEIPHGHGIAIAPMQDPLLARGIRIAAHDRDVRVAIVGWATAASLPPWDPDADGPPPAMPRPHTAADRAWAIALATAHADRPWAMRLLASATGD